MILSVYSFSDLNFSEAVRKIIKFFLTRYGAYEEFQNFKAVKQQQASEVDATLAQNSKGGM
ncbi:MAG: hypothetical protein NTX86_01850 [Candidatus Dependentiae bacterium]|nr:hypothetical protein [Candidatus Dependentiae bacterium]